MQPLICTKDIYKAYLHENTLILSFHITLSQDILKTSIENIQDADGSEYPKIPNEERNDDASSVIQADVHPVPLEGW